MRILIVSDTHRRNDTYLQLAEKCQPLDRIIHCGDIEGSEYILEKAADCPVEMVMGNNDFFSDLPREKEIQIGPLKIWITHGHNYYVSTMMELLKQEAHYKGVDVVCYGHTHRPVIQEDEGIFFINPGSLTYPRQEGKRPTYVIMEIDEAGKANFTLHEL